MNTKKDTVLGYLLHKISSLYPNINRPVFETSVAFFFLVSYPHCVSIIN